MKDKLRAIRDATKENVDYIAGLIGIGYLVIDVGRRFYAGFQGSGVLIKAGGLLLIAVLLYLFIRNFKKILSNTLFSLQVSENLYHAEEQATQLSTKQLIDFRKIIPTTRVLEQIYHQALSVAQKELDSACFLVSSQMNVLYERNPTKKTKRIRLSAQFDFYSPKKKMSVVKWAPDLRLQKGKPILSYRDSGGPREPFFQNKHWREAVIEACERTVVYLITLPKFGLNLIGYTQYDIYMVFLRNVPMSKDYSYSFINNKLYEGSGQSGQVLRDFDANP